MMLFGLTNALATFCNLRNYDLFDFLDCFVVMYLDDMVIYSQILDDHVIHLGKVLQRLRQHQQYVKKEKCEFA